MDKGFSSEWIEKLKANNDIATIVSKYTSLQRKGKLSWACCPFHYEKTPSFAVNEYEQYYKCFGCGVGGDVINFIEKIENVSFYDAVKILAENANMQLPEYTHDENIIKRKKQLDRVLQLLKDAAKYYYNNLSTPQAKPAIDYINKRDLSKSSIISFGLGYSLGWNEVVDYLKSLGYTYEEMLLSGVVESKNGKYFDCYAKRLIFPIINSYGDVVGFSGRVLEKVDFAKYKNTMQTIAFDKSKCVYAINLIKKLKLTKPLEQIIIVEGQMDVIALHQAGVNNAVACMGTALTQNHTKELKRFVNKVIICFDGDSAGIKATLRSIDVLVAGGMEVFVNSLPDGLDPDEFIKQKGVDQFNKLMDNAYYWVEYLIRKYAKDYNLDKMEEKRKFVGECLNVINNLQTATERDIYIDLVCQLSGISKNVIINDMKNSDKVEDEKDNTKLSVIENTNDESRANAYVKSVKFVLSALLNKKSYAKLDDDIKQGLLNSDFVKIYDYINDSYKNNKLPIIGSLFTMFDVENNQDVASIINYEINSDNDNENYYNDCVKSLIQGGLGSRQREIISKISHASASEKIQLIQELNEITKKLKK